MQPYQTGFEFGQSSMDNLELLSNESLRVSRDVLYDSLTVKMSEEEKVVLSELLEVERELNLREIS